MVSVHFSTPSTKNSTRLTPTLSLAVAVIVYVPETVAPSAGAVSVTAGGVVSELFTVTLFGSLARLPAASTALAVA